MLTIPRTSGIYQWLCVPSGKVYIGSAINLYLRRCEHLKLLRVNRHGNPHFQHAWNKYGESAFEFKVIELVLSSFLLEREQYWIDRLKAADKKRGFNIAKVAGSTLGVLYTDEARDNISRSKATSKVGFISPSGEHITIENMRAFCREHSLNLASMYALSKGKQSQHRGWTHVNAGVFVGKGVRHLWDGFIDPSGTCIAAFPNLTAFCKANGVNRTDMQLLAKGARVSYRGWTFRSEDANSA